MVIAEDYLNHRRGDSGVAGVRVDDDFHELIRGGTGLRPLENGGRENNIGDDGERDSRKAGDPPSFNLQLRIIRPRARSSNMV